MLAENLSKLGFSPSEIKIYLHLQKKGPNYANKLSAETGINRTKVYEALDRLISKGVVSFIIKNKIKWFESKNPNSIISLLKEKEREHNTLKTKLIREIKQLQRQTSHFNKPLEASLFIGKKGLRVLFDEILETKKPVSLIASEFQFKKLFGPYFEIWHKKRIKNKIEQRSIFPQKLKNKLKERKLLRYKFIEDLFTNPTTTIIYGGNCLFIQWGEEPLAIKIKNKEIIKSHLNYFDMLWKTAKP